MPSPLPPIKDSNQPIANGKHIVGWPCVFPRFEDSKQPTFSSDAAGIRAVARRTCAILSPTVPPHRTSHRTCCIASALRSCVSWQCFEVDSLVHTDVTRSLQAPLPLPLSLPLPPILFGTK